MSLNTDTKIAASICKEFRTLLEQRINIALDDRLGAAHVLALRNTEVRATGARQVDAWTTSPTPYDGFAADLLDLATIPTYEESSDGYITEVGTGHFRFNW